jgi:hypothetical protein
MGTTDSFVTALVSRIRHEVSGQHGFAVKFAAARSSRHRIAPATLPLLANPSKE